MELWNQRSIWLHLDLAKKLMEHWWAKLFRIKLRILTNMMSGWWMLEATSSPEIIFGSILIHSRSSGISAWRKLPTLISKLLLNSFKKKGEMIKKWYTLGTLKELQLELGHLMLIQNILIPNLSCLLRLHQLFCLNTWAKKNWKNLQTAKSSPAECQL